MGLGGLFRVFGLQKGPKIFSTLHAWAPQKSEVSYGGSLGISEAHFLRPILCFFYVMNVFFFDVSGAYFLY